jgi:hypothetical protein
MALALAGVLGVLGLLHVYWAIAGVSGRSVALPEVDGEPVFVPSRASSALVAAGLLFGAWVALAVGGTLAAPLSATALRLLCTILGAAFLARSVGEFRLLGFFKRVKGTPFARWDTLLFSPLSLAIALAFFVLAAR